MNETILGISAFYHDAAAAILRGGEVVAAAQEERFTRVKADSSLPESAIRYCLKEAGLLDASELGLVMFYDKPQEKFERILTTTLAFAPAGYGTFRQAIPRWLTSKIRIEEQIRRSLGSGFRGEVLFADHHGSHAASAFFPSPFEEAAIYCGDGVGEWATTTIGYGRGKEIELSHELRFPHSLGMLYSAFTYYCGFKVNSGEYKLMGLAAYGRPAYADLIRSELVDIRSDGSLWLNMDYFEYCTGRTMTSEKFHKLFGGAPRKPETMLGQKEMDLAASIQLVCEEAMLKAVTHAHSLHPSENLVMAGGVALNCVANGRILREGPFKKVWIQPAAGDAGGALGAALLGWHHVQGHERKPAAPDRQSGSFLGPRFENDEVRQFLESVGARFTAAPSEQELLDKVARWLSEGKIIGWFHGRMEFGPRSLGARSIIGDARSMDMQRTMNLKIKFRESFRPFAPCVLREHVHEFFEMREQEDSPYMLLVAKTRPELRTELSEEQKRALADPDLRIRVAVPRSSIPAVTHVDYSARVQTVDKERHGRFYRLLKTFYGLTKCPVIVNTSFNVRGEPIVCTPADAFRCFMGTDIDVLVLEDFLVEKEAQPDALLEDRQSYHSRFALD